MLDTLKRYFVANPARIFSIERCPSWTGYYLPWRAGNAGGFFWRGWRVSWRKPYAKCWHFDGRRWSNTPYPIKEPKP